MPLTHDRGMYMRISQADRLRMDGLARYYDMSVAGVIRMLVRKEAKRVLKRVEVEVEDGWEMEEET